ncbi:Homeobox domain [Musa troglodytarum]|uniref:Homeobox domain n=1 Tax=Musa troglodytarum TaxID=320322 RepID=A0A9E7GQU3_9LILI|nr:Homeobox domain [Musa troglodytarum]
MAYGPRTRSRSRGSQPGSGSTARSKGRTSFTGSRTTRPGRDRRRGSPWTSPQPAAAAARVPLSSLLVP